MNENENNEELNEFIDNHEENVSGETSETVKEDSSKEEVEMAEEAEEFIDNYDNGSMEEENVEEDFDGDVEIVLMDEEWDEEDTDIEEFSEEDAEYFFEDEENEEWEEEEEGEFEIVSDEEWQEESVEYFSEEENEGIEYLSEEEENESGGHRVIYLKKTAYISLALGEKSKTYRFYYVPSYKHGMMQKPKLSTGSVKGVTGLSLSASSTPIFDSNYVKIKASRKKTYYTGKATGYVYITTNDRKYTVEVTINCK